MKTNFKSYIRAACNSFRGAVCTAVILLIGFSAQAQNLFGGDGSGNLYEFATNGMESTFASGMNSPYGLAFNNGGNLFVADYGNGNIYKFTPGGVKSTFASGLPSPLGLAFDRSGNLFVASAAGSIYEFTTNGVQSIFVSGLNDPVGLAFNSVGNLFVTSGGNIYEFMTNGVQSTFAFGLTRPLGLVFDSADNLFVADQAAGNIYKFTPTGVQSPFASGLLSPFGLAFDRVGNLFVANYSGGNIYEYATNGVQTTFVTGLNQPNFIAFYYPPTSPLITAQPQSASVYVGDAASLSVAASGASSIGFQWQLYGTNILDATNATLAFSEVQLTNAGIYSVIVSNNFGFTNSANAFLQVLPTGAPSIQINDMLAVGTMTFTNPVQIAISGGFEDGYIFYTLDGSLPSPDSTLYSGMFTLTNSAIVQAMSLSTDFSQMAYAPTVNVMILPIYSLQTSVVGNGAITANPSSGPYLSNSVVTLTATPAANWLFANWAGDATGSQNPINVTMNGPRSVQAVFVVIPSYNLQTSIVGNGTITANPPNGPYLSNSIVTLTATPAANWLFAYWTNNATGNQNPLSLTMNGPLNVQAVFTPTYPVTASTPGGGSVTVNGQVIAPATYYPAGSMLTLAATPNSGWSFLGWQGVAGGATNPLNVIVNGTNNIQAIFGTAVNTNAVGSGSIVLSQPNPIPFGTTITVSAVPNSGKYFVAWSGAVSGTTSPTQLTVTSANPTVSGLFATLPGGTYSLGLVVLGNGSVAISPQQNYYNAGTSVTLSATPVPGETIFYGWTLDALGTNSPIELLMNSNQIVQANFGSLPIVSVTPLNQTVVVGSNAVLTANASGLPSLTFQWQNSQGAIPDQTNATYAIFGAQATNSGNYSVVVSNPFGSVTSAVATVTVVFTPSISLQPTNQIVAAGTSLTLSAQTSGTTPLDYQWQNSAGVIPGATNSSLILNPALTNYSDNYSVIVSNPYGVATSQVASVFVYLPVSIQMQPVSLAVPYSTSAMFDVIAAGFPEPTSYQWTFNGTNLPGETSSSLTINRVGLADTGYYEVEVSNGYSSTNSQMATLNMSPSIISPFSGATEIWGQGATISVGAIGNGTLTYQWYLNGVAIDGATFPMLDFASIQFTNAGLYSVVVSSPYGSVTNASAEVVVNPAGVSIGFYPGLTISGVTGYSYTIQSSTDLTNPNGWTTLTNLTLTQPVELWIDTSMDASSPFNSKTFYKVLPGQ